MKKIIIGIGAVLTAIGGITALILSRKAKNRTEYF